MSDSAAVADDLEAGGQTGSGGQERAEDGSSIGSSYQPPEQPFPFLNVYSFYFFLQTTPPRSWAIAAVVNPWFERISMGVILLNCVTLGMFRPCEDRHDCNTSRCKILEGCDLFISVFFMVEMAVKVLALGISGKFGYFNDTWNRLDAFIVGSSIIEYTVNIEQVSISAVRTVRVLRPLRAINRVPSLRILVMLLLDTLPMLGNVLMLCFFVFFIFGIIAVQLWSGKLHNRCFLNETVFSHINTSGYSRMMEYYEMGEYPGDGLFICSTGESGMFHCGDLPRWKHKDNYCSHTLEEYSNLSRLDEGVMDDYCINLSLYYTECRPGGKNPFKGSITFDNILLAWVAIFQVISLEGWADIMYLVQDSHSFYDFAYFIMLIVIGAFFMLNLCLVVIATQFSETKRRESRLMAEQRIIDQRRSTSSLSYQGGGGDGEDSGGCYADIMALIGHTYRRGAREVGKIHQRLIGKHKSTVCPMPVRDEPPSDDSNVFTDSHLSPSHFPHRVSSPDVRRPSPRPPLVSQDDFPGSTETVDRGKITALFHSPARHSTHSALARIADSRESVAEESVKSSPAGGRGATETLRPLIRPQHTLGDAAEPSLLVPHKDVCDLTLIAPKDSNDGQRGSVSDESAYKQVRKQGTPRRSKAPASKWRFSDVDLPAKEPGVFEIGFDWLKWFVDSNYFMYGIFVCILLNTVSMAVEFHNQPQWLTETVEVSNLIFSVVFALEMALKLLTQGLIGYIKVGYNIFDGFIVIMSMVELAGPSGESSGLSVLRTFRLLRVLKLVRFMPALRRQLLVMLKTMDNVATFFGLLMLFMFIFSILGMHLFGCKFCDYDQAGNRTCDRKNFDSLLWAVITVFQILTQEAWYVVLYNGMFYTTPSAAIYFIALMTFGNYILFNLLVAILVEGFSGDDVEKKSAMGSASECNDKANSIAKVDQELAKIREADETGADGTITSQPSRTVSPAEQRSHPPLSVTCSVPPTIIQTSATPPSSNSVVDLSAHLNNNETTTADDRRLSADRLMLPEERRGSSPKSAPTSWCSIGDYENRCPRSIETSHSSPPSFHEGLSATENNCHVLYDYQMEAMYQQVTYQLPPSVQRRLSLALQQQLGAPLSGSRSPSMSVSVAGSVWSGSHRASNAHIPPSNPAGAHVAISPSYIQQERSACDILGSYHPCFKQREEYSLFLFAPNNRVRLKLMGIVSDNWFDYTVLIFILLNCAAMALERPTLPPDGALRQLLDFADAVFTIVFTIEMVMKVVSKGLFIGSDCYIKSGWNVMDGILVCISLVDAAFSLISSKENKIFGMLRVFRLLRTLRPLRVISRAPGLKLVVQTLLSSLRPIGNIVLICCTFFIIFGILGVQLFKGTFYRCKGPDIEGVTNKTECLTKHSKNRWINTKYNFDNLPQALMSLFVLSSKDGWVNIMYSGLDAVGVDQQPIKNYNEWRIAYFISFLLLVGFFVLNMFVGVVVENFHKVRASQQAEEAAYKARILAHKIARRRQKNLRAPYWERYGPKRLFVHNLVMSAYFDLMIAAVIIVNVITMSLEHYQMAHTMEHALKIFNYFFTVVFILESAMKIYALGFLRFIKKRWNKLDLLIVVLSILGIVLEEANTKFLPINPTIIRVMRVFRIARVFKLLKMAKGVRQLLDTVMQALPQVGNLGLLFFLMFFIFAALGVELFGRIECGEERKCEGLSRHASFRNFGVAYLTLFRIATGDNWNGIMKDTLSSECDNSDNCVKNCCVSVIIAPIYFVVFVLMAQFVLVNVVVAVLMKHLEESHKQTEDNVDKELLDEYMKKYAEKERIKNIKRAHKRAKKNRDRIQEIEAHKKTIVATIGVTSPKYDKPISIVKPMIEGQPAKITTASVERASNSDHQMSAGGGDSDSSSEKESSSSLHDRQRSSSIGLSRTASEDKGTQTFECRINEDTKLNCKYPETKAEPTGRKRPGIQRQSKLDMPEETNLTIPTYENQSISRTSCVSDPSETSVSKSSEIPSAAKPTRRPRQPPKRSSTVSYSRMDSLEVPTFHPLGRKSGLSRSQRHHRPRNQKPGEPSGNRRQRFLGSPSISSDAGDGEPLCDTETRPDTGSSDIPRGSLEATTRPTDISRSWQNVTPSWTNQQSDDSQHSAEAGGKVSISAQTPDEHLSSPEFSRRVITLPEGESSTFNPNVRRRTIFQANPRQDFDKLDRIPSVPHNLGSTDGEPGQCSTSAAQRRWKQFTRSNTVTGGQLEQSCQSNESHV